VDAFEHPTTSNQGNTINQNIFFCDKPDQAAFAWEIGLNFGTMSGNWFCNPYTDKVVSSNADYTLAQFKSQFGSIADQTGKTDLIKRPADTPANNPLGTPKPLINTTPVRKAVEVGDNGIYKDLAGNTVSGSVQLDPFTSLVIVHTGDFTTSIARRDRRFFGSIPDVMRTADGAVAVEFALVRAGKVTVEVASLQGRLVARYDAGCLAAGTHRLPLNAGTSMAAGLYRWTVRVRSDTARADHAGLFRTAE